MIALGAAIQTAPGLWKALRAEAWLYSDSVNHDLGQGTSLSGPVHRAGTYSKVPSGTDGMVLGCEDEVSSPFLTPSPRLLPGCTHSGWQPLPRAVNGQRTHVFQSPNSKALGICCWGSAGGGGRARSGELRASKVLLHSGQTSGFLWSLPGLRGLKGMSHGGVEGSFQLISSGRTAWNLGWYLFKCGVETGDKTPMSLSQARGSQEVTQGGSLQGAWELGMGAIASSRLS